MRHQIVYEEKTYNFDADVDVILKIQNDSEFALAFVLQLIENNKENQGDAADISYGEEPWESGSQEINNVNESLWNHSNVLLFLEECIKRKDELRNPKVRRRNVFIGIKKAMLVKGHSFGEDSLARKLRNLKITYNKIMDNNKKTSTGRGRIPWIYMDQMCDLYSLEVGVRSAPMISTLTRTSQSTLSPNVPSSSRLFKSTEPPPSPTHSVDTDEFEPSSESPIAVPSSRPRLTQLQRQRGVVIAMEERRTIAAETIAKGITESNALKREYLDMLKANPNLIPRN